MKIFTKSVAAAMAILALAGCETVDGWFKADKRSDINVNNVGDAPVTSSSLDNAPGVRPVPNFPAPGDRDLKIMTSKLSGGSVEIYDLDGPVPSMDSGVSVPPVYAADTGIPLATDPRVTVYPLDSGDDFYGSTYPIAPSWPNATLPLNNYGGGMTPSAMDAGKLPSRAGGAASSIYFPYGSSDLSGSDRAILREAAETAKFAPVDRVVVEGYASKQTQTSDPVQSRILNLRESLKRAGTVSQELIEQGVPAEKIKTVGWGDTKPSGNGEAQERRVDIVTGGGY